MKEDIKQEVHLFFNGKTSWHQFESFFSISFFNIIRTPTFKIFLFLSVILLLLNLALGVERLGLKLYPFTYKVIDSIRSNTSLFLVIILIFFSGILVWKDRDYKFNEIVDATAHTSFISVIAKTASLVSVIVMLHLVFISVGIGYQLWHSTPIEIEVYASDFFYEHFPNYIIYSSVAIFVQVLLNHKYLGYFVCVLLFFALEQLLSVLGISTNLLQIAKGPSIQYSDLNGFGPGLKGALWFKWYWILFGLMGVMVAGALWNRGIKDSLVQRIKTVKKQLSSSNRIVLMSLTVLWLTVGSYIYYNAYVLNTNFSRKKLEMLSVSYEKKYKKHENSRLPKITDINYFIDIFPEERNVTANAVITLTNEHQRAIDTLYFSISKQWDPVLKVPKAKLAYKDDNDAFQYLAYKLDEPLQPGASIQIKSEAQYITKGFENDRGNTRIVRNGTMIHSRSFLPHLGYNNRYELSDNTLRKEYGLPEQKQLPELTAKVSKYHMEHSLSNGTSDFVSAETVISTSSDQIAIAPGSLVKKWKENNRNYYQYKTDIPSLNIHTFNSGRYKVEKRQRNGVALEVYYDAKHAKNVSRMLDAMEEALQYYTSNFGPYYHKQCRIIEVPRYVQFGGQAFAGTMLYNEGAGFVVNIEDASRVNIVDAVISHEIAHQWWAHQLIGANMQGHKMLSESLAEYSMLMTLKRRMKKPMSIREFLAYDHDLYLRGRSRDANKEPALYKVENQRSIQYGKGSVILYALQDYIGEEKINTALKNFLEEYRYKKSPYPSTLDFLRYLEPQVPDSLSYFVEESFKKIVLYDNRIKTASYTKKGDKYRITLEFENRKVESNGLNNETLLDMDDWIEVGFFLDEDETQLYREKKLKFNKEFNTLTFELDTLPVKAAIDPRHLLIDRQYNDNIQPIVRSE